MRRPTMRSDRLFVVRLLVVTLSVLDNQRPDDVTTFRHRARPRTQLLCLVLTLLWAVALAGCSATASLSRPEGDGGWSPEQRAAAIGRALQTAQAPPQTMPNVTRPPGAPLSLHEALRLAALNNRELAEARLQLDIERQRVYEARGRLLPSTVASGRYTWYSDPQTTSVDLPPGILPAGVSPQVMVRDSEAAVLNGTLNLPLDLSGEIRSALAAAQAGYRGEAARLWTTRLAQDTRAVDAYFNLLQAERLREVTEQTIALNHEQLDNAQLRYDNGRLTKNQLLVVQVALRDAEQRRIQEDLAIDRARWSLNQVLGLPVEAPTEVVDLRQRPDVPETAEALAAARRGNPVLASLLEEQQRLEATLTALERSRFPRFSAGGAIDYSSSDILQPQDIASGFVGFTWDLGTDTQREARIAAARRSVEQNRLRVERQVRELEEAVRSTQRAVLERLSAYDSAQVAVGQAEENQRIRRQQFDAGRATSEDVLDAEELLARQRAVAATALYEAQARRAQLQQLIGAPIEDLVRE
jgi:outer membrane protein